MDDPVAMIEVVMSAGLLSAFGLIFVLLFGGKNK